MNIKINCNDFNIFAVPDIVVDDGLKSANETQLKVLLYILKNKTTDNIYDFLNISEEEVISSISFWNNIGVILDVTSNNANQNKYVIKSTESKNTQSYKSEKIAERISESSSVLNLFESMENIFGRPLNFTEQEQIIKFHDYYGFENDTIVKLVDYCFSLGGKTINYISKVAESWSKDNVITLNDAEKEILSNNEYYNFITICKNKMQIDRKLSDKEEKFVKSWAEAKVDISLVMEAYNITVENINKVNFKYINNVLSDLTNGKIKATSSSDKTKTSKNNGRKCRHANENLSFDINKIEQYEATAPLVVKKKIKR